MKTQIIENILQASDLLELADYLEKLYTHLELYNQEQIFRKLLLELDSRQDFLAFIDDEPYQILDEEFTVNQYLFCILADCHSPEEAKIFLKAHIDDIRSRVGPIQGDRLSENDIHKIMEHLEKQFSFCERLFKNDRLKIAPLNNSFADMNSVYKALLMADESIIHSIFISYERKDFGHPQMYTLVHELGHALHTSITRDPLSIPSSFRVVQEKMFRKSLNFPSREIVEIFADCFVCVATAGTDFESGNPLSNIHPDDKEFLVQYFNCLLANMD